jgi:hypothetical protein
MSSANDAPKMELISLLASRNEFIPACPARTCTLSQHGFGGGVCAHTGGHTCCTGSVTWRAGGRRRDANCVLDDAVRLRRRIHLLALFDPAFENRSHVKGLERGRKLVLILHTVSNQSFIVKAAPAQSRAAAALAASCTPPGRAPDLESISHSRCTNAECLHVSSVPRFRANCRRRAARAGVQ